MKTSAPIGRLGRLFCCLILALLPLAAADAAGPATTTVADTVYRADGTPAAGTLVIAWTAFTTADGKAIPAGRTTVKIGAAGAVSIPLAPNFGATPEGTYYKVTYKLDDGSTSEEFWSVPAAPTTTISAIRSKLVPANVAVQYATRQYVDSMLAAGGGGSGNAVQIQGTDVDAVAPLRGQSLTFDGAKYKPVSHAIVDVVRDCGAAGDGITNDGPVIQACLDANKGKTIQFPQTRPTGSCSYLVSTAAGASGQDRFGLVMNGHGQRLIGDTLGIAGTNSGTEICFAAGLTGVMIPNSSAIAGVPAGNVGCQGCSVENLVLQGSEPYTSSAPATAILPGVGNTSVNYGTSTGTSQADGIRVAGTYGTVRDVGVSYFGRHGLYLDGNSAGGNFADSSYVENFVANNNRGSGVFNRGSDSNATVFSGVKCVENQLWCVENYSFLGSVFIGGTAHSQHLDNMAGHTSAYAISAISNSGNVTTVTTTTNHNFAVGMAAVISGTTNYNGTWFVADVPAANRFTFVQTSPLGAEATGVATNATATQMWAKAGGDAIGGCFRSTGGAVTSVFLNPYCESDNNGTNQVNQATNLIIGGDIGNQFDWANNPPNWFTTTSSGLTTTPFIASGRTTAGGYNDAQVIVGGLLKNATASTDGQVLNFVNNNSFAAPAGSKGHLEFRLTDPASGSGVWGFRAVSGVDNSGLSNYPFYMEYGATADSNNTNPKAGFPNGFWHGYVGAHTSKLWFGNINAVANLPTWFTQPIGSVAVNNGAAAGGFAGWIATSSGAPGTYRAFGPIANDATGTSWTLPSLGVTTLSVASATPVANLTLASDSQLPAITSAGKVAASALPDAQRKRICEVHIGSAAGSALTDGDDEPASCFNDYGTSLTISAVRCYADAGSPTVQLARNDSTNILSGNLACGTAAWALADGQSGRPSISATSLGNGQWLDVNIVSAGGAAKFLRVVVTMVQ